MVRRNVQNYYPGFEYAMCLFDGPLVPAVVDAHTSVAPKDPIVNAFEITDAVDGYMMNGVKIRRTGDIPPMISVYDFITAVTEQHPNHAGRSLLSISSNHPEVTPTLVDFKFPGRGQRFTPVTDARGLVLIMNLLTGQRAAQFRLKAAHILVRHLGGDPNDVADIHQDISSKFPVDEVTEQPAPSSTACATQCDVVGLQKVNDVVTDSNHDPLPAFDIGEISDGYLMQGVKIRRTTDTPPKISVYDILSAVTGQPFEHSHVIFSRLQDAYPELRTKCSEFKFPGRGQRFTPVTNARGFVLIVNLLPGHRAAQFRMKAADIMVRYLGGDQTLISEIQRNAAGQDALPHDNIGRLFGDAVAESTAIVPYDKDVVLTHEDFVPCNDNRYNVLPLPARSPNMVYMICLGLTPDETYEVAMFGLSQEGKTRLGQHTTTFPHCKVTCVITCGRYNPSPIEDALKVFFAHKKVAVNYRGIMSRECFAERKEDTDHLYGAAVEMVKTTMHDIVDSITFRGVTEYFSPLGASDTNLQLLREKTKQKEFDVEVERERTKQKDKDIEIECEKRKIAEAEVRKMELQLEIMRFQAQSSCNHG